MGFLTFMLALAALLGTINLVLRVIELEKQVARLERGRPEPAPAKTESAAPAVVSPSPPPSPPAPRPMPQRSVSPPSAPEPAPAPGMSFEELFGRRLPVWGGAAALALAGFFLVKYSIEIGLITPAVRVLLGLLFGLTLIGGAEAARRIPKLAADPRVAQALSGAGIATLYATAYMATELYRLISPATGFAAMAATTAAALGLSLRHGAPTAILGLLGGFATPALVNSGEANVPVLLGYLILTIGGLVGVARARGWRWLSLLALAGGYGWSGLLLADDLGGFNGVGIGLFIILLGLGGLLAVGRDSRTDKPVPAAALPLLSAGLALIQLAVLVGQGGFGWSEWGLYGLLSVGVTVVALRDPAYIYLPPMALGIALVTLMFWPAPLAADFALVSTVALLLFAGPGHLLSPRGHNGLVWTLQAIGASLGLFGLGYLHFAAELTDRQWAPIALLLALPMFVTLWRNHRAGQDANDPRRALLAAAIAILVGAVFLLLVPAAYRSTAFAVLTFSLALRAHNFRDRWTPKATMVSLIALFWPLQAMLPSLWAAYATLAGKPLFASALPSFSVALDRLLLPGLLLGAAAWLTRRDNPYTSAPVLGFLAVVMATAAAFIGIKQMFGITDEAGFAARGFIERLIVTQALFAAGALLYRLPGKHGWAQILTVLALARLVWFDLLLFNPVVQEQWVGDWPLLNLVTLVYGLPLLWIVHARRADPAQAVPLQGIGIATFVALVLLSVRQLFQGAMLTGQGFATGEYYAYSLAALVAAIGLLLWGAARDDRMPRIASLVLMLATVGKAFLSDAAMLSGLWRIASFLGLGLSLIGISWFYTRRVFARREQVSVG